MGKFANIDKMIGLGEESWRLAAERGLAHIRTVGSRGNRLVSVDGHEFINMVSCSYLGLNRHPKVVAGAIAAIEREGTMSTSVSRARIAPALLDETEALMSEVFGCQTLLTLSCTAASTGVLPLLASGHLTSGTKPVMIFDRNCHFSMNIMKAACGDETEVLTCPHNDLDFIEEHCKQHPMVAYVADGAYSLGDNAPIAALKALQERYGLFLYLDDSHSLSVCGRRGVGLARSQIGDLGDRTVIVGSLAKAFGATGGVILLGNAKQRALLDFFGGPLSWSQMVNAAGLGAIKASAELHLTEELTALQQRLRSNMDYFDSAIATANSGNGLPIRVIDMPGVEQAIDAAAEVFRRGFYTSAVFFPIVARGRAGLRAMNRADMDRKDIFDFCEALRAVIRDQPQAAALEAS